MGLGDLATTIDVLTAGVAVTSLLIAIFKDFFIDRVKRLWRDVEIDVAKRAIIGFSELGNTFTITMQIEARHDHYILETAKLTLRTGDRESEFHWRYNLSTEMDAQNNRAKWFSIALPVRILSNSLSTISLAFCDQSNDDSMRSLSYFIIDSINTNNLQIVASTTLPPEQRLANIQNLVLSDDTLQSEIASRVSERLFWQTGSCSGTLTLNFDKGRPKVFDLSFDVTPTGFKTMENNMPILIANLLAIPLPTQNIEVHLSCSA